MLAINGLRPHSLYGIMMRRWGKKPSLAAACQAGIVIVKNLVAQASSACASLTCFLDEQSASTREMCRDALLGWLASSIMGLTIYRGSKATRREGILKYRRGEPTCSAFGAIEKFSLLVFADAQAYDAISVKTVMLYTQCVSANAREKWPSASPRYRGHRGWRPCGGAAATPADSRAANTKSLSTSSCSPYFIVRK